jgi:type II secretory pathway component PulJ
MKARDMCRVKSDEKLAQASRHAPAVTPHAAAFTLLEVMIAAGILFMCLFAILQLLAGTLRNARALQHSSVDAGMLAAELSLTNKLSEGTDSGDFEKLFPDFRWERTITEAGTNGLFEVHWDVYRRGDNNPQSKLDVLMFKPESTRQGKIGGL